MYTNNVQDYSNIFPQAWKFPTGVSLDDVDWDMFRASSSDVSEFTDVALSFVNTLTEQATETVTIRTFSNQKPWVDRSIRDAVNHCTAAYNAGLLSGNMCEYKASWVSGAGGGRSNKERQRLQPLVSVTRAPLFEVRRMRFTHRLYWHTHLLH